MKSRSLCLGLLLAALGLSLIACTGESEPPPCTPLEGETRDPCEGDLTQISDTNTRGISLIPDAGDVGSWLDFPDSRIFDGHIVARGQYIPGTVRCVTWSTKRVQPHIGVLSYDFGSGLGSVWCYADLQVADYMVGSGPSVLTVLAKEVRYWDRDMTAEEAEAARSSAERVFVTGGSTNRILDVPPGGITGVEAILFLGPAIDASIEAWQVMTIWDVERRDDGTVIAVDPYRWYWQQQDDYEAEYRSKVEIALPAFKTAAKAAHQARLTAYGGRIDAEVGTPQLVTDVNNLHAFHVETGNVNHPDGPPVQPPPVR